jgi:hypothetical protein
MAKSMVDENGYFHHHCPGCKSTHIVPVAPPWETEHRWTYSGSVDAPTLNPSVKHNWGSPGSASAADGAQQRICHYFITEGRIEFCGDSTHSLAGQTLPLVNL